MGSQERRPHALVIPLPHQGHWIPMKIFIRQLVTSHIPVTVLATPSEISELKHEGIVDKLHYVELVEAFSDPPKVRLLKTTHTLTLMKEEFSAHQALKDNFSAQKAAGSGPTFLVSDMFLYWTQDLADELRIPRYSFFTSPTTFALLVLHAPDLIGYDPNVTQKPDVGVNLPGMEMFRASDICTAVFELSDWYGLFSKSLPKCGGILINSWESYEVAEVAALRSCLEKVAGDAKVPSIHLIGPVQCLPVQIAFKEKRRITLETDSSGCLRFLDGQSAGSVLYICFGSIAELDETSLTELARALELCDVPFLWILARPNRTKHLPSFEVADILPPGFQSRTKGRGLVCTHWAPQPEILAHSSTGGFMSHCGWNSLVESIMAGVAVITWPSMAEQFMNARFVMDVVQVGLKIQSTAEGNFVAEQIAKAVTVLMKTDEGKEKKVRMQEIKRAAETAVGEGGSSLKAFRAFEAEVFSLED